MTQEDRQLLLKDLCSRVPYHPKGHVVNACNGAECDEWLTCATFSMFTNITNNSRLYLRPMSSMTEEEKEELKSLYDAENVTNESICFLEGGTLEEYEAEISFVFCYCVVEWLLENHFDFMGLIPKGLAIEVTEENNPYERAD